MKKLVSLALALVLVLGVTVIPVSAADTRLPFGHEGVLVRDECTCDVNPVPELDTHMFWEMGMKDIGVHSWNFDDQGHIVSFDIYSIHGNIHVDLRTDEGKALYAEYEAKWQAMKNAEAEREAAEKAATEASKINPDFDETIFSDLGLTLDEVYTKDGITHYHAVNWKTGGAPFVEDVTNALGDEVYAKYKAMWEATAKKPTPATYTASPTNDKLTVDGGAATPRPIRSTAPTISSSGTWPRS